MERSRGRPLLSFFSFSLLLLFLFHLFQAVFSRRGFPIDARPTIFFCETPRFGRLLLISRGSPVKRHAELAGWMARWRVRMRSCRGWASEIFRVTMARRSHRIRCARLGRKKTKQKPAHCERELISNKNHRREYKYKCRWKCFFLHSFTIFFSLL